MKMASPTMLEQPPVTLRPPAAEEALYEVVNGQRVELPSMGVYASWITSRLHIPLGSFVEAGRLGTVVVETLFILDPERNLRRRPDVAFVSAQSWPLERPIPEEGDWEVIPNLAIEVISRNDLFDDVLDKMNEYFAFGVQQVWLVVPKRQHVLIFDSPTRVRILSTADELDGGSLLPGFRLPVAHLFQHQGQAGTSTRA
jgi:Uma2 family endonuclease